MELFYLTLTYGATMTKRTFGIEGYPDQRTSATRTYTHAILGSRDITADRERAISRARSQASGDHEWYTTQVGRPRKDWQSEESYAHEQLVYVEAKTLGKDAWVQKRIDEAAKHFDSSNPSSGIGVIQWSSSPIAALNAVGSWRKRGWHNVSVVPCFETKARKGAPSSVGAAYK